GGDLPVHRRGELDVRLQVERVGQAVIGRGWHAGGQVGHDLGAGRAVDVPEVDQLAQHGVVDREREADLRLPDRVHVVGQAERGDGRAVDAAAGRLRAAAG